jgi:predicted phosphoadenosine phosphosulfate sulfurtransferase
MLSPNKHLLNTDVLTAARGRISWMFDTFERVCVSFSGGKDSSVMFHLVMEEAIKRDRVVGVMFVDWEVQFTHTIEHVQKMFDLYKEHIEPYWIALPFRTENCTSMFEPEWICWEPGKKWVRDVPASGINDYKQFPFYTYPMTFEEFVPKFGQWYSDGKLTAVVVGIRADESLHRYSTITSQTKTRFEDKGYTTQLSDNVYNVYPIYDWKTTDVWTYNGKYNRLSNPLYTLMYRAGVPLHNMRVDEPFGEKQRKGLWLYHILDPIMWAKIVERINGANFGALYVKERGNILGNYGVTKPESHTWKSYAELLLNSMPIKTAEHYKNKIAVYLRWYQVRDYPVGIPDYQDNDVGPKDAYPSWRRVCKILLRNDYWCKGLSFSVQKSSATEKYLKLMKIRRELWNLI